MHSALSDAQRAFAARVDAVVAGGIAERAARYDAEASFPVDDFRQLHREGLLLATLDERHGGLGHGFAGPDPLCFFLGIERLARGNPSTAHSFQVHGNGLQLLARFGSDEQVARFTRPTLDQGLLMVGSAAEPGGTRGATVARPVPGGFRVTGRKHYATNAVHSRWMIVFVRIENTEVLRPMIVDTASEGLTIDSAFYRPAGMRACISPMLEFNECFIPDDCVLEFTSAYLDEQWPARINFGFTANYIGALDAMLEWSTAYATARGPMTSPIYLSHVGEIKARLDAVRLIYYHAVGQIRRDLPQALVLGTEAKWLAVEAVGRCIELVGQYVGSTALFTQFPLERMMRDMQQHTLHRRHHPGAVAVGSHYLGQPYDLNQV